MEITPTTAATAAPPPAGTTDQAEAAGAVAGDFQTFLTLLTTQMRNQDPLKPMEFDRVRRPARQLLRRRAAGPRQRPAATASSRCSRAAAPAGLADGSAARCASPAKADFAGEPVEVGVDAGRRAPTGAVLVVRNDFDQVVARLPVAADADDA